MKTIQLFVIMILTGLCVSASAQGDGGMRGEKFKAQKVAFITQHLDLSEKEAIRFWPIYNEREKRQMVLREKQAETWSKGEPISEAEANTLLAKRLEVMKQEYELEKEYMDRFKAVISAEKLARLIIVEQRFVDRMVQTVKRRMKNK